MEFATKKDLIKKYAEKRKVLDEDDVKDLLDCFINYTLKELRRVQTKEFAYGIDNFGDLFIKEFDTSKLLKPQKDLSRIVTERQMKEYIFSKMTKPKKIYIRNDKKLRI